VTKLDRRIPFTKQNIKLLKHTFEMSSKRSDGDVIEELISNVTNENLKNPNLKSPSSINLEIESLKTELANRICLY